MNSAKQSSSTELALIEHRLGLNEGQGHLTPTLNAALNLLCKDESLRVRTRIEFRGWRGSWGNWSRNYLLGVEPAQLHLTDSVNPEVAQKVYSALRAMIIGPRKCPGCAKTASRRARRVIHPQFRWHVNCLARAFAVDAIAWSPEPEERQWARWVLAGRLAEPGLEVCQ